MESQIVMSSKDRLLSAINGPKPDRLPVVTHHVMPSFLNNCLGGASEELFFEMRSKPNVKWSTFPEDVPYSMSKSK